MAWEPNVPLPAVLVVGKTTYGIYTRLPPGADHSRGINPEFNPACTDLYLHAVTAETPWR